MRILFVCTGNTCRSRMAEAFMTGQLAARGVSGRVFSRGILPGGRVVPSEVTTSLRRLGEETSSLSRESLELTAEDLEAADVVIGMAREHVRHTVVMSPTSWDRSFTLKELVRRGGQVGPRASSDSPEEWTARVGMGRERSELLGASTSDDVSDPIGRPLSAYLATANELLGLVSELADLLWPTPFSGGVARPRGSGKPS
ncbi:MAG: hypothetical protein M0Z46_11655 [Actinomycetota bacterium]|nr:hypothetical protein [Actinomycetota bacterium]